MYDSQQQTWGQGFSTSRLLKLLLAILVASTIAFCGIAAPLDYQSQTAYAVEDAGGSYAEKDGTIVDDYGWGYFEPLYFEESIVGVAKGKTKKLKSLLYGRDYKTLTWSSSNKKVVKVSKKGVIKAKKPGTAKITVRNKYRKSDYAKITIEVYKKPTKNKVYKALMKLKSKYREGKTWGNEKFYYWRAANMNCYACIALAGKISDKLFGKSAPLKVHRSFKKIKIGDHIRLGGPHSVIVLTKNKNSITVVEGNYNGRIHWGRTITRSELAAAGFAVWTRY